MSLGRMQEQLKAKVIPVVIDFRLISQTLLVVRKMNWIGCDWSWMTRIINRIPLQRKNLCLIEQNRHHISVVCTERYVSLTCRFVSTPSRFRFQLLLRQYLQVNRLRCETKTPVNWVSFSLTLTVLQHSNILIDLMMIPIISLGLFRNNRFNHERFTPVRQRSIWSTSSNDFMGDR